MPSHRHRRITAIQTRHRDGRWYHPLYGGYRKMLSRCYNPNHPRYQDYGGRGITVTPEWAEDFWRFVADVGERPLGKSLDRIDNDGPYAPHNVHWATPHEQRMNRRPTLYCRKGHLLHGDNAYGGRGVNGCRTCRNERLRVWRLTRKSRGN